MSAILSADDLNDFISPGVACIKPVETLPTAAPPPPSSQSLEFEVILDGQQQPTSSSSTTGTAAEPAQISLTDCLACSGCVTSAEAVLVSLQSHNEVLSVLDAAPGLRITQEDGRSNNNNGGGAWTVSGLEDPAAKLFVASVSPQTRASLAAACGGAVTEQQAGWMMEQLLLMGGGGGGGEGLVKGGKFGNGFTWVVDTNTAREACLVLGSDEVLGGGGGGFQGSDKPAPPILTSSCPGWVCYAEKTHPYVLPHLSRVKSPQALMGTLLKTTLSRVLGISPDRIWHLAVMPCFDKKLEASREELTDAVWAGAAGKPGRGVRDVDCVITSKEILILAASRGIDFFGLSKSAPRRQPAFPDPAIQRFLFPAQQGKQPRDAGTSGGNLHFILHDVQSRHTGSRIQMTRGRNADVVDYAVVKPSGEAVFKAARYYGFRNIQNLVRKLKPAKPSRMPGGKPFGSARRPTGKSAGVEYAYVEVMACPGGCTNGGGQIKVDDQVIVDRKAFGEKPGPDEQKAWLAEVDEAYFSGDEPDSAYGLVAETTGDGRSIERVAGISPLHIRDTLAHWSEITGIQLDRLVYTSYREVVSDVGKQISDTERVVQLAGKIGGGW
ncbi:cytosolic Fe-S cluster assembly factor NAR1 [Chaetomidium leptoderma]|uniref:Cytosolic Fe-S cluster assembly factor NAR1 n=1 Tax=Chaetomidium leptoderma TaxID=669021 RepID=A0AAN6ZUH6_9PEZI|nr:cytosolic Fe-S cluster assembly factor NAR1 [Chaetomidium leptoderma]